MSAAAMSTDAELSTTSLPPPPRTSARARGWDGTESPWLVAAWAAAPWPLWALVAWVGTPGGAMVPSWIHGPLALSIVLAAMVIWAQRPSWRQVGRWVPSILGTGLMAELLADALTDMGRSGGIAGLDDPARAIATWTICVAIYEVAPIVAASSRITRSERRIWSLDLIAHAGFVGAALLTYRYDPIHGELWRMSPWLAAAITLPLAAARCGPVRPARLPDTQVRGAVLWGLAAVAWALAIAMTAASTRAIEGSLHDMRWGVSPIEGVLLALPATSALLSLGAAGWLVARALGVRRAPRGVVARVGDRSLTLEVEGAEEPLTVALDEGEIPDEGQTVTLLGATRRRTEAGPFRDGVPSWRARRAWVGAPGSMAEGLTQRAAAWTAWAGLSAIGLLMLLW